MPEIDELTCIAPAKDRRVRTPEGAPLEGGETVRWSSFWQRRLDDKDIRITASQEGKDASAAAGKGDK